MSLDRIPLADQIIAILRVRRIATAVECWFTCEQLATQLDQQKSSISICLQALYDNGEILRQEVNGTSRYRIGFDAECTPGCCCCCDGRVFASDRPFCEECAPAFSGRV